MGTLEVRSLSRIRDGVLLFDEVSFTVADGHIAAIAGPALSGKTSLLRVIAGVERSDGGDVLLDGQSLLRQPAERRHIGFLFDDLALFEDMTVHENVSFGLRMQRRKRVDRLRRTDEVLDALGLGGRAHRKPSDLSPGERKRLAFARAVAPEPALLLLDEPTAGVEEVGRDTWRQELAQALRALHVTTLIATTDLRDAVTLADDLVLMAEGQILQTGTVARVLQGPSSIEAATLAGYVPLLRGDVAEGFVTEPGVGSIPFPAGFPLRQQAAVMAHPTALFGVPGGTGLGSGVSGSLLRARPDGPVYVVEVQLNDRFIALRWEWDLVPPEPGTLIEIAVRPGTLRFFNDSPAPRVRSAESPAVDSERFAALAPRAVAGAEAPGPRTAQPPPPVFELDLGAVDDSGSPDDLSAEGVADAAKSPTLTPEGAKPSADASAAVTGTSGARPKPEETATQTSDPTPSTSAASARTAQTTDAPTATTDATPTLAGESGGIGRAGASRLEQAHRAGAEPVPPAIVAPTRLGAGRLTPLTGDPADESHSSSDGPSPAAAPPPKADDRHSGMPLD